MAPTGGERKAGLVTVEDLEIHCSEWGASNEEVVFCVHGFSRTGRDFDVLAQTLSGSYRVLCPDLPGRGLSQWSSQPAEDYSLEGCARKLVALCDRLDLKRIRWVGISFGAFLGVYLAGGMLRDRITHLVVNETAPGETDEAEVEEGVERVVEYLKNPPSFPTLGGLEAYYREVYEPLSSMTDAEWRRYTLTSARRRDDGQWTPNYDVGCVDPFFGDPDNLDIWDRWDQIDTDVLVLRGEHSDILTQEVAREMQRRGPDCRLVEFPDCGHFPCMNVDEQITPIRRYLES